MARSILRLVLKNNMVYEFRADQVVAEAIAQHHEKGGVFFALNENEGLSVDFTDVRAVQVTEDRGETINSDTEELEKVLFKIECRCGASYFAKLSSDSESCRCRACNDRVFVDWTAPLVEAGKGRHAVLATNKYRVPRRTGKKENGGE